jgi:hypothetical protein
MRIVCLSLLGVLVALGCGDDGAVTPTPCAIDATGQTDSAVIDGAAALDAPTEIDASIIDGAPDGPWSIACIGVICPTGECCHLNDGVCVPAPDAVCGSW